MDTTLLNIIIPVYNGEKYIPNLIEAFRRQTDDRFQLIFIDDGSGDNSYEMLCKLAESEPFSIKVYRQENQGVSRARNRGIELAQSRYITFVDVDDFISEDYIAVIYENLNAFTPDAFVIQTQRVKESEPFAVNDNARGQGQQISPYDMLVRFLSNPTGYGVVNVVMKREFLLDHGVRFAEGYRYYEDYDFLYRLFAVCRSIVITERILYFYILREGSAMSRFTAERFRCLELMEKLRIWLYRNASEFLPQYDRWAIARIYWSLMWQAAIALPSIGEACRMGKLSRARSYMKRLKNYPDRKVRYSAGLYCLCPFLFFFLAKLLGASRTKASAVDTEEFRNYFTGERKRILVYGMTCGAGGIEAYIMNTYRSLDREKLTFDFVTDFPTMAYEEEVIEKGSYVYKIPAKGKNPIRQLWALGKILRLHKEYDTVYFNILDAGAAFTMLEPFIHRRRIVVHSHSSSSANMKLHGKMQKLLLFLADNKLACSDLAGRYMFGDKAVQNKDVTVIPNAIDLDKFRFDADVRREQRRRMGISEEQTVILHVGRMTPEKNPFFLLDITEALVKKKENTLLLYVGWGDMEEEIKAYAKQKGLTEKNVNFLGMSNRVPLLMQAADVFLMPSLFEGLPVAGIEAQAADLTCFFSDNITGELKITDKVWFMNLEQSADKWAERILSAACQNDRRDNFEIMTAAGYNMKAEKDKLVSVLLRA